MKQRNIIAVIIYSIITFGIYDLFWLYSTKKELNAKTKVHVPSLWWMFAPALFLVAALVILVLVSVASRTSTTQGAAGQSASAGLGIVTLLLSVVAIPLIMVIPIWWFLKYSKAVGEYTNGAMSTAVSFLLLWLLRFVGIAVIQDHFNDMIASGQAIPTNGQIGASVSSAGPPPSVPSAALQPPINPVSQSPVDPTSPNSQPAASSTPPTNLVQ